ncbi:MAG: hypothetical protein WDA59_01775 [Methanofastidiosum sp.]
MNKCEYEDECICMTCAFNWLSSCGCAECSKLGKEPFFAGDCPNYLEKENEKSSEED